MAMYQCFNCGKWVSAADKHDCSTDPWLRVLSKSEVERKHPYFKTYKPKFYFKNSDKE